MDIITMHLVFSHMCGRREDIFENLTFYFLRIWYRLWSSGGGKAMNFIIPLTKIDTCNNWPYTFQEEVKNVKLLTHDGRRPFAIGHPSESGDHKELSYLKMEDKIVVTTEILSKRDPIIVHVNRNVKISSESEENADPQACWLEKKRQERMIVSCFCLILYKMYIYSFCI